MKNLTHIACLFVASFGLPGAVAAELLFYDGFDSEPAGGLPPGWVQQGLGWSFDRGISEGSLTYPNLLTTGNKWALDSTGRAIQKVLEEPILGDGTIVYFSLLLQVAEIGSLTDDNRNAVIEVRGENLVMPTTAAGIGFGRTSSDGPDEFQMLTTGGSRGFAESRNDPSPVYSEGETIFIVWSYRPWHTQSSSVWINPDPAFLGTDEPPEPTLLTSSETELPIDSMYIRSSDPDYVFEDWYIDEIRFGTTWASVTPTVPEPSTYAMLAGAAVLAFAAARRRKMNKERG